MKESSDLSIGREFSNRCKTGANRQAWQPSRQSRNAHIQGRKNIQIKQRKIHLETVRTAISAANNANQVGLSDNRLGYNKVFNYV